MAITGRAPRLSGSGHVCFEITLEEEDGLALSITDNSDGGTFTRGPILRLTDVIGLARRNNGEFTTDDVRDLLVDSQDNNDAGFLVAVLYHVHIADAHQQAHRLSYAP